MGKDNIFRFKQFSISNSLSAMRVGTDGVLLGAWCPVNGAKRILDIGAGTGVIALMAAQRNSAALIDAIEIDSAAAYECKLNFASSPWADRMSLIEADFNEFYKTSTNLYDTIVANPPYFIDSLECPDNSRARARHSSSLSFNSLIHGAKSILSDHGKLCIITPVEVNDIIEKITSESNLYITRKITVYSISGCKAKRIIWEICQGIEREREEGSIVIENADHSYTAQYIELTHDFYLKM